MPNGENDNLNKPKQTDEKETGVSRLAILYQNHRWLLICCGITVIILIALIIIFTGQFGQYKPGRKTAQYDGLTLDALSAMAGYGLMPVQPDGFVQQDRTISRAEFASLLSVILQADVNVTNQQSYADIMPSHPQYLAIESLKEFFGYQNNSQTERQNDFLSNESQKPDLPKFDPDAPMIRSEAVTVLSASMNLDQAGKKLADILKLPADDPILKAANRNLLSQDAARLFYLLIASRLPAPAPTFAVDGIQ